MSRLAGPRSYIQTVSSNRYSVWLQFKMNGVFRIPMQFQQFPKIIIISVYSSLLRSKRSRRPSRLTPRTAHQIKFGEPVITGFTRSFAQRIPNSDILNGDLPNGERREYLKPMLFSGGVGQLDDRHLHKGSRRRTWWW